MDIVFHYPPELLNLLVDTIPLLNRSKRDVLLFFQGAGVPSSILRDLSEREQQDRAGITKYEITRTVLARLNSKGEASLRERREILKRVVEFEKFSVCWPSDQLKAKGLVADIRQLVDAKDSFARMRIERDRERQMRMAEEEQRANEARVHREEIDSIKRELFPWFGKFGDENRRERGKALESILNRLFKLYDISVRESFAVVEDEGVGISEQIDGVIDLTGNIYLVEMKWVEEPINVDHVSRHLLRVYHRGYTRGIFVTASDVTKPALQICRDALQKTVVFICELREIVMLLENDGDLVAYLKEKESAAIVDKNPFKQLYP